MRPWIFVHVPKNAGTAIAASLGFAGCAYRPEDRHASAAEIRKAVPEVWEQALTFGVVRNPWDRAVSAWAYQSGRMPCPGFEGWLRSGKPLRSQWDMLSGGREVLVERVLRYEDLEAGFAEVVRLIGCGPRELLIRNESVRPRGDWRGLFTPGMAELAAEQYADDVERFGYRF